MLSNRTRHPSQSERALYLLYFINKINELVSSLLLLLLFIPIIACYWHITKVITIITYTIC